MEMKNKMKMHRYIIVYLSISLLIIGGLLSPGYILTLDMVFGPESPTYFSQNLYGVDDAGKEVSPKPLAMFLYFALVRLLDFLFPVWLIQKMILLSFLMLSGISMHRSMPVKSPYAKYFAGFLYMINPFIYVRFFAGHFHLLWSYAILPFLVSSFIDVFEKTSRKNVAKAGILLSLITPQLHFLPISLGIFVAFLMFNLRKGNIAGALKPFFGIMLVFLALNVGWTYSLMLGESGQVDAVRQVGYADLALFTSKASVDFNVLFNVAAMYGFWRGGYELPKESIPYWYMLFFFILFLAVHGFLLGKDDKKLGKYVKALSIVSVVSLILATGVTHEYFSKLFYFLYENVPLFTGFREPQKFVVLIAFTYAYLGGIAVDDFASKSNRVYALLILLALAAPFAYTYTMFFGFSGQLKSIDYPEDYYEVDELLNGDEDEFSVLFLPWHGYMDFKWLKNTDKRIANPATAFFAKPVIRGDTVEAGGIYSQSTYPVSKYIEFLLVNQEKINNFGELISPLNVKYIILAKEADYENYLFLFNQSDLELMRDTPNLYLFKNRNEVGKIYEVDEISAIDDWDITSIDKQSEKLFLKYEKKNPAKYVLTEQPTKRYVVFAAPYSEDWRLGSKKPLKNLGITNAYVADEADSMSIENTNFKSYLIGYIISGIFFVILIREATKHE